MLGLFLPKIPVFKNMNVSIFDTFTDSPLYMWFNSASRFRTMPALFDAVSIMFNGGIVLKIMILVNAGIVIKWTYIL